MAISRSRRYEQIADQTATDYRNARWSAARRWLRRVGLPRLTAEAAAIEADGLLRSINAGLFRNNPDLAAKLAAAREACNEFTTALARDNWARFEGRS